MIEAVVILIVNAPSQRRTLSRVQSGCGKVEFDPRGNAIGRFVEQWEFVAGRCCECRERSGKYCKTSWQIHLYEALEKMLDSIPRRAVNDPLPER